MIADLVTEMNKKLIRGDKATLVRLSGLPKQTIYSIFRRKACSKAHSKKLITAYLKLKKESKRDRMIIEKIIKK